MLTKTDHASALDAEIQRLTENDSPQRAKAFAAVVRRNVAHWEEFRREDPRAAEWALLEAYNARTDAQEQPGSIFYLERQNFIREKLHELVTRDGRAYAHAEPHRRTLLRRPL